VYDTIKVMITFVNEFDLHDNDSLTVLFLLVW